MTASPLGQFRGYPTERRFPEPIRESPKAWLQRCGHDFTTSIQSRFGKQNQRCPDAPSDWIQSLPPPVHSPGGICRDHSRHSHSHMRPSRHQGGLVIGSGPGLYRFR